MSCGCSRGLRPLEHPDQDLPALQPLAGRLTPSARGLASGWAAVAAYGDTSHTGPRIMKKRRSFEAGHQRKFLIVADNSPEVEAALYYAASRVQRSSGTVVLLYVIEPAPQMHWLGVKEKHLEEETAKATALFRLFRRKLSLAGFGEIPVEEAIRDGSKSDQIMQAIDADEDIAILVLGAAADAKGPGPLVASFAAGKNAGSFPIPITIVPGYLALADIKALA